MSAKIDICCLLFALVATLGYLGCESNMVPENESVLNYGSPVVPGLIVTSAQGTTLGIWENPYEEGEVQASPNPFCFRVNLRFYVGTRMRVRVWVVRAIGPYEDPEEHKWSTICGSTVVSPPIPVPVKTLVDNEMREPGNYRETWDTGYAAGHGVSPGFYRIYVQTDILDYVDVLVWCNQDPPPGLEWLPYW